MKLYIQFHPDINQCILSFGENHSKSGAVIQFFPEFFGIIRSRFLLRGTSQNFTYEMLTIRNTIDSICAYIPHNMELL